MQVIRDVPVSVAFQIFFTIRRFLTRRTQNGGHGGKGPLKIQNAHQACRLAKRVSLSMISAIAQKDNPDYYDDCVALGKRGRVLDVAPAEVPVEDP